MTTKHATTPLAAGLLHIEPAGPLWQRAPTRDADGRLLADFMMIIPRLARLVPQRREATIRAIEEVLQAYHEHVVFADLNLRLSVLWVSVRPLPGLCIEIPAALHARIPEARLVAPQLREQRA
ncbi:hypothetical protein HUS23_09840 [Ectothiorhodospiraceae bacterium 2226]|nr:hypothetical protein HUS23_09840 [Ectothiorhodospiraceae bacterium 2226]